MPISLKLIIDTHPLDKADVASYWDIVPLGPCGHIAVVAHVPQR